MPEPPEASQSSSDYFGEEDSQFLEALQNIVLPGDAPPAASVQELHESRDEEPPPSTQPCLKRSHSYIAQEQETIPEDDIYGPSHFGQFGEYMRRKRAKLQIQNNDLETEANSKRSGIFKGIAVYINGWTKPSVQDLRRLIVENEGTYQPYLDRKSIVTHIITRSLTPAKIKEFKSMKVVRPEWLTESVAAGVLLPWKDFIYKPSDRVEGSQGTSIKQQKTFSNSGSTRDDPKATKSSKSQSLTSHTTFHNPISTAASCPDQTDPVKNSDFVTQANAAPVPEYASAKSNPNAIRAMANPGWRKAHTSMAPDFIESYYKNSRLHHLATWKSELRALVMEAQDRVEANADSTPEPAPGPDGAISMRGEHLQVHSSPRKWKGKGRARASDPNDRVIMHCDFDCFFVSAGLVSRPELKGKPVVVCHSQGSQGGESSTSEIASCSYEAREFDIRNGMSLQQARKLCPTISTIPYEFERYKELSLKFYTVLLSFADDLQAVSVDEALIDVTDTVRARAEAIEMELGDSHDKDPAKEVAENIRDSIRKSTGCEVSIGIAHNILLARLATRRAKPAKSYHLVPAEIANVLAPLEVSDLHGFGHNTKQKLVEKLGTSQLGKLLVKSKRILCDVLGPTTGETLYNAIRGIDHRQLESSKERKSVSCEITYGIRFEDNSQAEKFVYRMAEEVKRRLDEVEMSGRMITLRVMRREMNAPVEAPKFLGSGKCETFSKQSKLIGLGGSAVNDDKIIGEHAWRMLKSFNFDPKDLRGIGIQVQKVEPVKSVSAHPQANQMLLPFKKVESSLEHHVGNDRAELSPESDIQIQDTSPPSIEVAANPDSTGGTPGSGAVDLPSFSQVDMSVFDALPREVREELEMEYKRRLALSPAGATAGGPSRVSAAPERQKFRNLPPSAKANIFPRRHATGRGIDYSRITQQLAPRHGTSIYANKSLLRALGLDKPKPPPVRVSDAELRNLDIDPEVFAMLPVKVQREQLVRARLIKKNGSVPDEPRQRKILKPAKPFISPSRRRRRGPAPKAVYIQPPILRQQGREKKQKLCFFETDDIQSAIEKWVTGYRHWAPKEKDIEFFSKYLLQCIESREGDTGLERAVSIMKWWLVLLRRMWGHWEEENVDEEPEDPNKRAAVAWWKAFRVVKQQMDEAAKKQFGGKLSLK